MQNFGVSLFLLSFSIVFCVYDEKFARYTLYPLVSAAYGDHPEKCIHDSIKNASLGKQVMVSCDPIKEDTCSGYTAVSYTNKAIIIVFRGGLNLQDVEMAIAELFENRTKFIGGGSVSVYFWNAFYQVWTGGIKDSFLSLKNANPSFELWIAGHSMGAAMASLCAGYIAKMGFFSTNKIKLVTFGQPRVGDLAYASYIDSVISYSYRVVHHHDIAVHLPPLWFEIGDFNNYTHHKSEVWYDNDMTVGSSYVECDVNEGQQCSDQLEKNFLNLTIIDHDYYFNLYFNWSSNGCPGYNQNI